MVRNATEIPVTIDNFRTIAQKTKGELLPPAIGRDCQDIRFDEEYGSIEKRTSRVKYGGMSTLGTSRVIFLDRFYKNSDSSKTLICAYSTFLKKGNDSTGSFTNIKTGLTATLRFKALTFKNVWYGCNGTDAVQAYDGSNVEDAGVPIPTAPSAVDAAVAGNPDGTYKYKVIYQIENYQEGTASAESTEVVVVTNKITVTIPVSSNSRVTDRTIYRTQDGGSIFYFLATVADNSTTTYLDDIADGSLDTTIIAPTDYGAPPAFRYMYLHKSRVFGGRVVGNLSRVAYSDIRSGTSYPDVFPSNNFFDVIKDNGEDVTFVGEDNFGQLIIMKPSAVIKLNTDTDDPVGWSGFTDVLSTNGCVAPYSAVKTPLGIIYVTRYAERKKRLMLWNGTKSEPIFDEIEPILSSVVESRLSDIVCHYQSGHYYISYTDSDSGNPYNDRVIIIDLISGSWVIDKKSVDCFANFTVGTDKGELYTGTSDATGLVILEDATTDDGTLIESAIEMIYLSQKLDFSWINKYSAHLKRVRKQMYQVRIDFERSLANGTFTFGYFLDDSTVRVDKDFDLSVHASKGFVIYQFPIATFPKTIQFRFYQADDTSPLKITAAHFLFSPEPRGETF